MEEEIEYPEEDEPEETPDDHCGYDDVIDRIHDL